MSAKKAIRLYCKWCCMNSNIEITNCPSEDCPLWPFREGLSFKGERKQRAIKRRCDECIQNIFTTICKDKTCSLYVYRKGKRPVNEALPKRVISSEQQAKMRNGLLIRKKMKIVIDK